ncbi:MAG TPA: hypothetical protein VFF59_05670, partial [Anaerolineae bacterium]|nr:hypothetical protein [Anaerolineae bacterium]
MKKTSIILVAILLITLLFLARDPIRAAMVAVTGEDNLLVQVRGTFDYATNLLRPMPVTADDQVQ